MNVQWQHEFGLALPLGKKYSENITVPVVSEPIVEETPMEKPIKVQAMDQE